MPWVVVLHPDARTELARLPPQERAAVLNALEKLQEIGPDLGSPHSSAVQGAATTLRELRPRGGRSPWRPLYRRIEQRFVILAIAPEASVSPSGFRRSVAIALTRLESLTL
jgi:hypothetical protein